MTTDTIPLPKGIIERDLKYPAYRRDYKKRIAVEHTLMFHYVEQYGWVIATLHIRNPGRWASAACSTARTYAIRVKDKQIVTVGMGPHVKKSITVKVWSTRLKALQPYVDLYNEGMEKAGQIRDRISSRRANTVLRRGAWY